MKAHAHTLSGSATWLAGCVVANAAGLDVPTTLAAGGAIVAGGMALAPDMDVQGTAARSLGWFTRIPAYGVAWLSGGHRKAAHWAVTGLAVAAAVWLVSTTWIGVAVLVLGIAWCEAGFAADNRPSRRLGTIRRALVSGIVAAVLLHYDRTGLVWLAPAVLVGWWVHLLGDMLTTDRWPVLAPFVRREFGGWRVIRPTPRGQRVTWTERLIETGLFLGCLAAVVTIADAWPLVHYAVTEVAAQVHPAT